MQRKQADWVPFSTEELRDAMAKWKAGKSTGPDGVSLEALKYMGCHDKWELALKEQFNQALYKGRLPESLKASTTLKWKSQLLLARVADRMLEGAVWQYARLGRQAHGTHLSHQQSSSNVERMESPVPLGESRLGLKTRDAPSPRVKR